MYYVLCIAEHWFITYDRAVLKWVQKIYHVNELGDGEAELHDNYITDVSHGPGPLIVTNEEFLKEFVFCVCVSPAIW